MPTPLVIADAKEWYVKNLPKVMYLNQDWRDIVNREFKPSWDNATLYSNAQKSILTIPLLFASEDISKKSERFIVIENDSKTNTQVGYIIEYQSDEFISSSQKRDIFTKPKTLNGYTGMVKYFTLSYMVKELIIYDNGKITEDSTLGNSKNDVSVATYSATGCTDWYWEIRIGGVLISSTYLYTTCSCAQNRLDATATLFVIGNCIGGGGRGGSGAKFSTGKKPLAVFGSPCLFQKDMWAKTLADKLEYMGVITTDGRYLVTGSTEYSGGEFKGLFTYNGTLYYTYPVTLGEAPPNYAGLLISKAPNPENTNPNQPVEDYIKCYFVPIRGTVHTHAPCINDGSSGINSVGDDDNAMAGLYRNVNHYVLGCDGVVGQFQYGNPNFFNIGNCSTLK